MSKERGRRPSKIVVEFLKSAVVPKDYPPADRIEIAIAGRSNAGKSSFINALTQGAVAKVSQNPGKTRLLNFFNVGKYYRLVDMPGYGWAARDLEEMKEWHEMVEFYLSLRDNLHGILLLIDCKRDWSESEHDLFDFASEYKIPMIILLTKTDRMKPQELSKAVRSMENESGLKVFPISSQINSGIREVERWFFDNWIKDGEISRFAKKEKGTSQ